MDDIKIKCLTEFKEKINNTGLVSKSEVLSLEENFNLNVFSLADVTKYLTDTPTCNGVIEVKKVIDKTLSNITTPKTFFTYRDLISHISHLGNSIVRIRELILSSPECKPEVYDIIFNKKYALEYDEVNNEIKNIIKDTDITLALNSFNYINKIFEEIFKNKDIIEQKLEMHNDIISNANISTFEDYTGYSAFLTKLFFLATHEIDAVWDEKLRRACAEKMNMIKVLEIFRHKSKIVNNLNFLINELGKLNNVNSSFLTKYENIDIEDANIMYENTRLTLDSLISFTDMDVIIYKSIVNILTTTDEFANFVTGNSFFRIQ